MADKWIENMASAMSPVERMPAELTAEGRNICSPEHPMPKGATGRWAHTNVREVGTCMDGCCADYRCNDCGHKWREELPQ